MFLGAKSICTCLSERLEQSQSLPVMFGLIYHGDTKIYQKYTRNPKSENKHSNGSHLCMRGEQWRGHGRAVHAPGLVKTGNALKVFIFFDCVPRFPPNKVPANREISRF